MRIPIYQIDAFAGRLFEGNPAAVCLLPGTTPEDWPDATLMQSIAAENNLAETAFLLAGSGAFPPDPAPLPPIPLRWFTPGVEMDLCGHATLAAAAALFRHRAPGRRELQFASPSGVLRVFRSGEELLALDFPARPPEPWDPAGGLVAAVGGTPRSTHRSRDVLFVYDTEDEIRALTPDFARLHVPEALGIIVTAPGRTVDFVSRFFAPGAGIPEDPVTGSAHCTLIPYWAERLGKQELEARQLSARGGELFCRLVGDRVEIAGRAVFYLEGFIDV